MNQFRILSIILLTLLISLNSAVTSGDSCTLNNETFHEKSIPSKKYDVGYTTSLHSNFMTPVDLKTGESGEPIAVPLQPQSIMISPDGDHAYLLSEELKQAIPINLTTGQYGNPICSEYLPQPIRIHPDEKEDYLFKLKQILPARTDIEDIHISPDGKTAYVIGKDHKTISVINLQKAEEHGLILLDHEVQNMALYPKQALIAHFTHGHGTIGIPCDFDATSTKAFTQSILHYFWDFGDGETEASTTPFSSHMYHSIGEFTVSLTVTEMSENIPFKRVKGSKSEFLISTYETIINIPPLEQIKQEISNPAAFLNYPKASPHGLRSGIVSTTTLSSSAQPAIYGQPVTFTAILSGGTTDIPTGVVTFTDGATQIGIGNVNEVGVAIFTTSTLSVGSHTITASYSGDAVFDSSVSSPLNQTINQAATSTAITSSLNPAQYGQTVTFTAIVNGAITSIPTGVVSFSDGLTQIGSGTLDGTGTATFSTSLLNVGSHSITASYGGDTNFLSSTSSPLNETITVANTTTTLSSSVDPAVFGQSIIFTAVVFSPVNSTPTGTVTFSDGMVQIGTATLDNTGTATLTTSNLSTGTHAITASYGGNVLFAPSNSLPWSQTVNQAVTSTAVTSSLNPSIFGESITITAAISIVAPGAGSLTGTVEFFDGATSLGTSPLSANMATLANASLSVGTHTITAVYSGDVNFFSSTSSTWNQTVNQGTTNTGVTSSVNPAPFGQSVILTANVTIETGAGTVTGTVSFFDGSSLLGTSNISSGQAALTTSLLSVGTHLITAIYNGNTDFTTSTSSALPQIINKGTTNTLVTSSSMPSTYGQTVTFTGTVSIATGAGTPIGSVTFFDGPTALGTTAINAAGNATLMIFDLSVGMHPIAAVYSGDSHFLGSTSTNLNQAVNQATPLITLSSSANPSAFGNMITFTSTVSAPTALGLPTGIVSFYDNTTLLGTGTLVGSGSVTSTTSFATSNLFGGSHSITAVYGGDNNFTTAASAPALNQVINQALNTSTIIFSNSPNPTEFGQTVTLRSTITGSIASPPQAPTGSVIFYDGTTILGTVSISPVLPNTSTAMLNISTLTTGSHSITAAYQGDVNYPASTSTAMIQNVIKTGSATTLTTSVTPSVFGQTVMITATVQNNVSGTGNPTGNLQFYNGATLIGSVPLVVSGPDSSVAVLSTSALALGSHTIIGIFNGDVNFTSSTSSPLTQVVVQDPTSVNLSSSLNPSSFGNSVTFTAMVTANSPGSGTPTGTVQFFDGAAALGSSTLTSGAATFSTIALYPSASVPHSITAVYSGDLNFITSTSPALTQVVQNTLNTVTTVTSERNSSPIGQAVTFNATVTAMTGSPIGTVTFFDNGISFGTGTIVNGVATVIEPGTDLITLGLHPITATFTPEPFQGAIDFNTSTSPSFSQYVVPLNTTTTLTTRPNHSEQAGALLSAQVNIIGGIGPLTGSVTFYEGSMLLPGSVAFNPVTGLATLTATDLHFGSSPITAIYSGDQTTFAMSSDTLTQQVQQTDMLTTEIIISSSLNTAYVCEPLTLTATVIATQGFYTPTGSVTFFDGQIEVGSALLDVNGVAALPLSNLEIGMHSIIATYNSDSNYAFSSSNIISVNIVPNTTTTTFTIIPLLSNTPYGQNLIFVAQTTSLYSIPTGTMTFSTGSLEITLPLDATGQTTLETSLLSVGTNVITATYNPTSCFNASLTHVTHIVDPSNPTTALSASPTPSVYGETITITAMLSSSASVTPTGTVTFFNGTTNLGTVTLVQGAASITASGLPAGLQILKANYSGDENFTATSFPSIIQTITQAPTSVGLVCFSPNPSEFGQLVTFEATVASLAARPTGTITFLNGSTVLGTVPLNPNASAALQISNLNFGANSITATYNGDANFSSSTSSPFSQSVIQSSAFVNVTSSPNPSTFGNLTTFNIAVSAINPGSGVPTGTITAFLGSQNLGSDTLTNGLGSITSSALPAGTRTIEIIYSGDAHFTSAQGLTTQSVIQAATTTALGSSNNPAVLGQPIAFTATVSSSQGTPTGTVSFVNGTTTLATQTLNGSGAASFTTSNLDIGSQSIRAVYSGSANLASSTSAILTQAVNKASTVTVITSLNNPSFYGKTIVLNAQVSATSPATGIPTGTVTFFNGSSIIGTETLDSLGNTSISSTALAASSPPYVITAQYNGSSSYNVSTSAPLSQIVNKTATLTNVVYSPDPSLPGNPLTLNITITPINTGSGVPSGNVNVLYGSTIAGSGTLNANGQTTIVTSNLPAGILGLVVEYAGDSNFLLSSSSITQSILQNNATTTLISSANPSVQGAPVTFTATINVPIGTATGTVAFFDGTTSLGTETLNTNGSASLTLSNLLLGNHSITVQYSGDANNSPALSPAINQLVNQASTTTNLSSIPNPTFYGETVTLYAVVGANSPATGIPSGTVTFINGTTPIGTIPLSPNGQSLLTISSLAPGNNSITATYNGSSNFSGSTSATIIQTIDLTPSIATVTSIAPNPSTLGSPVILDVSVSAINGFSIPTGTVNAYYGSTLAGSGILSNGQTTLSLTNLPAGVLGIVLDYSGDNDTLASSTPLTLNPTCPLNSSTDLIRQLRWRS